MRFLSVSISKPPIYIGTSTETANWMCAKITYKFHWAFSPKTAGFPQRPSRRLIQDV